MEYREQKENWGELDKTFFHTHPSFLQHTLSLWFTFLNKQYLQATVAVTTLLKITLTMTPGMISDGWHGISSWYSWQYCLGVYHLPSFLLVPNELNALNWLLALNNGTMETRKAGTKFIHFSPQPSTDRFCFNDKILHEPEAISTWTNYNPVG